MYLDTRNLFNFFVDKNKSREKGLRSRNKVKYYKSFFIKNRNKRNKTRCVVYIFAY